MTIETELKSLSDEKLEIRSKLEDNEELDLGETQKRLDEIEKRSAELLGKLDLANKIELRSVGAKQGDKQMEERREIGIDSVEYRNAFMDFVQTGEMAEEFRAVAMTSSNAAVIPATTLDRIIEKMEVYGNILPLVTKTSYAAGLSIPKSDMGITASWVAEGKGADRQGAGTTSVTFGAYKLQARVGVTLEMHVKALSAFEAALINNVAKAMTKAVEQAIVAGDGAGKPTGILRETVPVDRALDVKNFDYKTLIAVEAAIPAAYDSTGIYVMSKKSFMSFAAMTDAQGQPIGRVDMGITGKPERTLLGRSVLITEYLPSYEAAAAGDVFAFVFDFSNYVLNTGYSVTFKQFEDNETDDIVTKATMLVDGKVVENEGLVLLKKPASK